ncbi:MAG: glycosyl transferase family 4, partial [Candidatus Micrarchaeota archaeon]|nr:glycosyl transferase family 4 [Candidatus Micrarchaeota archaeon]
SQVALPLLGVVQLGQWYPLVLVPLAVVSVSNATNMLAGINGIEAGMAAVMLTAIGAFLLQHNSIEGAVIAFCAAAALLAFLKFNWIPAKMFPGDSLTYFAGAAIVSAIVIGNAEKLGILLFIPWIIEAFLKLRGRFKVRSYGDLQKDGTLKAPYEKIYSLTHVAMKLPYWLGLKKGFTEKQVACLLIGSQIILSIGVLAFYNLVSY